MESIGRRLGVLARSLASARRGRERPIVARSFTTGSTPSSSDFSFKVQIQTNWNDNDQYGHVNNAVYYNYFDTAINKYLISEGGLRPEDGARREPGSVIGFCVESGCTYLAPIKYPDVISVGVGVDKIGTSSCRYRLGIFQPAVGEGDDSGPGSVAAHGYFVHVFVDAASHRPVAIPDKLRAAMEALR